MPFTAARSNSFRQRELQWGVRTRFARVPAIARVHSSPPHTHVQIVLSTYSFHGTHTLTFCQGVVAIICLLVMRHYRFTSFPLFDVDIMRKSAMLSMLYFGKILTSTISLGRVNVPMFTSLRQLSIVFVMVEEYVLLGESGEKLTQDNQTAYAE